MLKEAGAGPRHHRPLRATPPVRGVRRTRSTGRFVLRSTVGLTPIVCVGETLDERDGNRTLDVLDRQVRDGLSGFDADQRWQRLVVAYEPVWAIGTGRNGDARPGPGRARAHQRRISRGLSVPTWPAIAAESSTAGSVKPANASELSVPTGRRRSPRGGRGTRSRQLWGDRGEERALDGIIDVGYVEYLAV